MFRRMFDRRHPLRSTVAAALLLLAALPALVAVFVVTIDLDGDPATVIGVTVRAVALFWPLGLAGWLLAKRVGGSKGAAKISTIVFLCMVQGGCWVFSEPMWPVASRARAYEAAMRSDLKNLASQQEIYFAYDSDGRYSESFPDLAFTNTDGVVVEVRAGEAGWTARATHRVMDDVDCAIFQGEIADPLRVSDGRLPLFDGEPFCSSEPPFGHLGSVGAFLDWYLEELRVRWPV